MIVCAILVLLLLISEIVMNRGILTKQDVYRYTRLYGLLRNNESSASGVPLRSKQSSKDGYMNNTLTSNFIAKDRFGYFVRPLALARIKYNSSYRNPCWWTNKRFHCLPSFFVAGFPKCGSHELYSKLDLHPDIVKPVHKEINWWTRRQNVSNPMLQDYINSFRKPTNVIRHNPGTITYDASAQTVWDNRLIFPFFNDTRLPDPKDTMARKIHRLLPEAKCILIVRNPVDRLYSDYLYFHWLSLHKNHYKSLQDFHIRVTIAIDKMHECLKDPKRSHARCMYGSMDYWNLIMRLRVGIYIEHVRTWLTAFPANQLLVIRLEDYSRRPATTLQRMFLFLGVKALPVENIKSYLKTSVAENTNQKAYYLHGPMLNETRDLLIKFYRPYNKELAELLHDRRFLYEDN